MSILNASAEVEEGREERDFSLFNQFPDGPDDFESAGMKLVPPDGVRRYVTMSCELCSWFCREHDEFKNLMIISGDNMDFRSTLQMLKQRRPVNILLAHPENAPRRCPKCRKPLEDVVAESGEWFWESLAAGGDSIAKTKSEELLGNTDYS
ncbi:hypothetical protein Bca101_094228 [Brassica carinata]